MSLTSSATALPAPSRLPAIGAALAVCVAVTAFAALNGPLLTIRPLDPATGHVIFKDVRSANGQGQNQIFALGSFDAHQYAEQQWSIQVVPQLQKSSAPLIDVLEAIAADPGVAAERYAPGHQANARQFVVQGEATVSQADVKSPMGLLTLDFPGNDKLARQKVQLLTGPLVISTALRDVMPDMSLNAFTNQTQYADVAAALNTHAMKQAYGQTAPASLVGKTIVFTGVFSLQSPSSIRIVPVSLTVKE